MKKEILIITTTYPKLTEAKKLAEILLTKKLAACIQFSKIDSIFRWNEKITSKKEILVTIKTNPNFYKKVEKVILDNHSYKVPQILALKTQNGLKSYLEWILEIS